MIKGYVKGTAGKCGISHFSRQSLLFSIPPATPAIPAAAPALIHLIEKHHCDEILHPVPPVCLLHHQIVLVFLFIQPVINPAADPADLELIRIFIEHKASVVLHLIALFLYQRLNLSCKAWIEFPKFSLISRFFIFPWAKRAKRVSLIRFVKGAGVLSRYVLLIIWVHKKILFE
jgi:hypothetical protein